MRGKRAIVDDPTALRLLPAHHAERLARTQEGACQIDVNDSLPLLQWDLVEFSRRRSHAGVVEEQVNPTVSCNGDVEQVAHGLLVGDVGWHRIKTQVGLGSDKLLQSRTPPTREHHQPPITRETGCDRCPDSGTRSGYYRDLVVHGLGLRSDLSVNDVSMKIAILGTGAVGPALAKALSAAGHQVTIGTRDPEETRQREQWAGIDLPLVAYGDLDAEVLINATNGRGSLPALQAVGEALDGKVVIDTSNPLDFSQGFPPSLFVSNTDSLAEQLQRELPQARLVKMFNTMANQVMVNPRGLGSDSTIFVAGNDAAARQTAASVAADLGWTDVFDLGDLTAARGLEMYLPLWVRIFAQLGRPEFNIKLVR
jgi:predicted dinucleotide-binding enzyme